MGKSAKYTDITVMIKWCKDDVKIKCVYKVCILSEIFTSKHIGGMWKKSA